MAVALAFIISTSGSFRQPRVDTHQDWLTQEWPISPRVLGSLGSIQPDHHLPTLLAFPAVILDGHSSDSISGRGYPSYRNSSVIPYDDGDRDTTFGILLLADPRQHHLV